jgi:hypothetical protein
MARRMRTIIRRRKRRALKYGLDIEGERRREAGFKEEIWRRRETEIDAEITRLRERCALLDSLLGEAIRHGYLNERECPPTGLAEAKAAVTDLDKFKNVLTDLDKFKDNP